MKPKLLFLVTEDWYFYSHRLPMARAARDAGYQVGVICRVVDHRGRIEAEGIDVVDIPLDRRSLNPFPAVMQVMAIVKAYRKIKPDIVHHIAMKPILYGSVAAWVAGVPAVLNAFAGLGFVFRSRSPKARIIRPVLVAMFRVLLRRRGSWTLFQNGDDQAAMRGLSLVDEARTAIIRGSGVDTHMIAATAMPEHRPFVCVYAGRMIDMKGLPTLQDAFSIIRGKATDIHLWLCGKPDPDTPGSWTEDRLRQWCSDNPSVKWMGHQDDMPAVWSRAHVAIQPTWGGEGLPKTLLEAGACGRAMVASDVSGNREIVINGRNGFLVPERSAGALADAIMRIADNRGMCEAMGRESRSIVEADLSADSVAEQITALYARLRV